MQSQICRVRAGLSLRTRAEPRCRLCRALTHQMLVDEHRRGLVLAFTTSRRLRVVKRHGGCLFARGAAHLSTHSPRAMQAADGTYVRCIRSIGSGEMRFDCFSDDRARAGDQDGTALRKDTTTRTRLAHRTMPSHHRTR